MQAITNSELKKQYKKSRLQISNWNEKLDTILSQVNAPENSIYTKGNTHNGFNL